MQLNKYISHAGICSRRKAVELIAQGHIVVDHAVIREPGYRVQAGQVVLYQGQPVRQEKKLYILLNKPRGYVTTVSDEKNRRTVMDLVQNAGKERMYPVGRLDRDTSGLVLMTNDGLLAQKLSHPKFNITKAYRVILAKALTVPDLLQLRAGIKLEDGFAKFDTISYIPNEPQFVIKVELHSGRNRIVRRMFAALGYDVKRLDRVGFAGLSKKNLPQGAWRPLTHDEIARLQR